MRTDASEGTMKADKLIPGLHDGCAVAVTHDSRVLLMAPEQEEDVTLTAFGAQFMVAVALLLSQSV
jgi:hypothetical protein